jgi:hypothetical protein
MLRIRSLVTVSLATLAAAMPATAEAYTAAGVCGGGFRVIDQHHITGPKGGVLGTAYLLYERSSGRNCAVTIKRRATGIATFTEVSLAAKGGRYKADGGEFKYYAGPLYVHAPGRCVIFGGRMRDAKGNGGSWITPRYGHCG